MTEVSVPRQEIQRQTEGELPEYKIFRLLSSVGNAENKALELIIMREGVIYSRSTLWQEVMSHQTKNRGWKIDRSTPLSHCRESLSPVGLVTKEALSPDGSAWGYGITQFGIHTGIPFAGTLLKWSYDHPQLSLYKMFGATSSSSVRDEQSLDKKRAQEKRYKIFWEISTNPKNRIRLTDIADGINETDQDLVAEHLKNLHRNGILYYESTELGKPFSYLKLKDSTPDEEPKPYRYEKEMSARVYSLIQSLGKYSSIEELINLLIKRHPEYEDVSKKQLLARGSNILSDLERQGYVVREKFNYNFHSEITLSEEQRETILSLVTLIDNFKNGNRQTIEDGRRFAQQVANDPNLFTELMLKAKGASPFANTTAREELSSFIISILHEHPNSTSKQIQHTLETYYDKKLGVKTILNYLSWLVKEEKVVFEKTKSGNVYQVVEDVKN